MATESMEDTHDIVSCKWREEDELVATWLDDGGEPGLTNAHGTHHISSRGLMWQRNYTHFDKNKFHLSVLVTFLLYALTFEIA